ncbi:MAG: hypothetical protein ABR552_05460, partial [Actinomycetota bacterium]
MNVVARDEGDTGLLLRRETVRALSREHQDLVLSLRALSAILREPQSNDEESEAILARILEAELNQISVLDGELLSALRLELGDPGAVRELD